jgi:hypothetical protein
MGLHRFRPPNISSKTPTDSPTCIQCRIHRWLRELRTAMGSQRIPRVSAGIIHLRLKAPHTIQTASRYILTIHSHIFHPRPMWSCHYPEMAFR